MLAVSEQEPEAGIVGRYTALFRVGGQLRIDRAARSGDRGGR